MRLKRVIKKIAALSAGATMVGATVLGAMAADLGDYPSPLFIKDGRFSGILVVGDKADAKDIIGITDIMGSLQYAATKTVAGGATTSASISEGVKIDKSSDHLNFEESFVDIEPTGLDADDLPLVLADGVYDESEGDNKNDVEYEQELAFNAGTATLVFYQDDDDAPLAGDYLFLAKNVDAYTYELDFDDDLEYNNETESDAGEDLETTTLVIQGNTYTITDVKLDAGIDKLYLQAGETTVWLDEGTTLMRTIGDVEHEIMLVDVEDVAEGDCGISVDGVTQWVGVGSSKTISGVEVGVTRSLTIHSATQDTDTCQVNLGAVEIMLETGAEIEVGGEEIDGSLVTITDSGGALSTLQISYTPEDKVWIPVGGRWVDPVFSNFEYNYAGLTLSTESIEVDASSDDAELVVLNNDGKELEIPFYYDELGTQLLFGSGADEDELLYTWDDSVAAAGDVTNVEGVLILKVLGSGEARLIEIKDIDLSDNKVTFKDITGGGEKTTEYTEGIATVCDLPEGTINITINESVNTVVLADVNEYAASATVGLFETNNEGEIGIVGNGTATINITLYENPDGSNDDGDMETQTEVKITLGIDTADNEIEVSRVSFLGNVSSSQPFSDTNDDDTVYMTYFGTYIKHDSEDKRSIDIEYPSDEVYGNAFVSRRGADVTTTIAAGESVVIQRISVGATKLASEVSNVEAQNAILVGGPCANAAAADALGNPADCAAGFEEGKGLIQLVEFSNGNVAMIVAGYSADDTRNAAKVVANYADYALSGSKMEVAKVGTSLTVASATG